MANKPKNKLHAMKGSKKEIPLLTLAGFARKLYVARVRKRCNQNLRNKQHRS
jgi:hypothetical protein